MESTKTSDRKERIQNFGMYILTSMDITGTVFYVKKQFFFLFKRGNCLMLTPIFNTLVQIKQTIK